MPLQPKDPSVERPPTPEALEAFASDLRDVFEEHGANLRLLRTTIEYSENGAILDFGVSVFTRTHEEVSGELTIDLVDTEIEAYAHLPEGVELL